MPIYTYRCEKGHEWDEVRSIEGSETSEGPCETCVEGCNDSATVKTFIELCPQDWQWLFGRKVPARPSVKVVGGTPIHYPNRGAR